MFREAVDLIKAIHYSNNNNNLNKFEALLVGLALIAFDLLIKKLPTSNTPQPLPLDGETCRASFGALSRPIYFSSSLFAKSALLMPRIKDFQL